MHAMSNGERGGHGRIQRLRSGRGGAGRGQNRLTTNYIFLSLCDEQKSALREHAMTMVIVSVSQS